MAGSALALRSPCGTPEGLRGPESRDRAFPALLRSALQRADRSEAAKICFPFIQHKVNRTPLPPLPHTHRVT